MGGVIGNLVDKMQTVFLFLISAVGLATVFLACYYEYGRRIALEAFDIRGTGKKSGHLQAFLERISSLWEHSSDIMGRGHCFGIRAFDLAQVRY